MKVIGLTGGIGSGKSTIAKMFEELNIPVYYADVEAKKLINSSKKIKSELITIFGKEAFVKNKMNRLYIANIVFKDNEMLKKLNNVVHPEVEKHFKNWVCNQSTNYVIQENAIIFENNNQNNFDDIITVTAPEEEKVKRVMARDNTTEKLVLERMHNQLKDKYKIERSKFVIHNTDLEKSSNEVMKIHLKILKK